MPRRHRDYLLSFHGTDIGLTYELPPNVRVLMYCLPGKAVSACDANEARTWAVATDPHLDAAGSYLRGLRVFWDEDRKPLPYCVFSGNLRDQGLHRLPDVMLDTEFNDFKTGLFQLPARFDKVMLKDQHGATPEEHHQPGDVVRISSKRMHRALRRHTRAHAELDDDSFLHNFIRPGALGDRPLNTLSYVVVPRSRYYCSHSRLRAVATNTPRASSPNTSAPAAARAVQTLAHPDPARHRPLFLSDVIRLLRGRNPGRFLTVVASVCRSYHDDIPTTVQRRQHTTPRLTIADYLRHHAANDLRGPPPKTQKTRRKKS